jgi:hypothetical protein
MPSNFALPQIVLGCIASPVIWTATGALQHAPQAPAALLAFEQARRGIASGRVEWCATTYDHPDDPLSFVSRYARNGDIIFEHRGDADGWTILNIQTREGLSKYPQLFLINEAGTWHFQETDLACKWWPKAKEDSDYNRMHLRGVREIRAVGVSPFSGSLDHLKGVSALWPPNDDPIISWSQDQYDQYYIVRGLHQSGALRTWYIAADRGWNAERITVEFDGKVLAEVQCTLARFGETWFPTDARYYRDGALWETVSVKEARFNDEADVDRFTLRDLGVEPGSTIAEQWAGPRVGLELLTWTGEGVAKLGEWLEGVKTGKWSWGPTHQKVQRTGVFESHYDTPGQLKQRHAFWRALRIKTALKGHEGLWEQYVRDFINRYQLDREQCQKASLILLECQRRADELIQRRLNQLTEIVSEMLDAAAAGNTAEAAKLRQRLQEGLHPIDAIFEQSLKPRLEPIPTRAQRKAAEDRAADNTSRANDKAPLEERKRPE